MRAPCKDCPDRHIEPTNCHDTCQKPEYVAWKKEREKVKEAKRIEKLKY